MVRSGGAILRAFGWLICLAGCANYGYPWRGLALRQEEVNSQTSATDSSATSSASPTSSSPAGYPQTGAAAGPDSQSATRKPTAESLTQEMPEVIAELERIGAIDVATRERLVADLKRTDPALWPELLSYFKASLAYREKYVDEGQPAEVAAQPAPKPALPKKPVVAAHEAEQPALLSDELGSRATPLAPPAALAQAVVNDVAVEPVAYQTPVSPPSSAATPPASQAAVEEKAAARAPLSSPAADSTPAATAAADETTGAAGATAASPSTTAPPAATATAGQTPPAADGAAKTASTKPGAAAQPAAVDPLDWRGHLKAAIAGLEHETAEPPGTTGAIGRYAGLRLLYLVDGNRDSALRPLAGVPPTQQDFWSEQLFGLSTYLDAERTPDEARRAAAAVLHLRDANTRLSDLATLTVRNLAFATEVQSYGNYKKFEKNEFKPGQEVLLYAEVENFKSAPSDSGFHTALKSSYQILDNRGARVDQKEFEVTEEHCQNPRRDYFIRYFVWMPKRIYGGTYTLQLTIEDTLSQKIGQASIEFTVADQE